MPTLTRTRTRSRARRPRLAQADYDAFIQYMSEVFSMTAPVTTAPRLTARDSRGRFIPTPQAPSIKNIYRCATRFCELANGGVSGERTLRDRGFRPPNIEDLPSLADLENIRRELVRYQYVVDHNIRSQVGNLASRACQSVRSAVTRLVRLRDFFSHEQERAANQQYTLGNGRGLKVADVFNDLLAVTKNFETIWDNELKTIAVVTPEICLTHPAVSSLRYRFGRFFLYVPHERFQLPKIKAHTPRWSYGSSRDGNPHPHIHRGQMCFGNGSSSAQRALEQGRLFDIFEIMMSVLNSFGTNPYAPLDAWNGICDERFNPITGEQVAIDQAVPLPPSAIHRCTACSAEVERLVGCYDTTCTLHDCCEGCVARCPYEGTHGVHCDQHMCEDHECYCERCERSYCGRHFNESDDLCDNCYNETH